VHNGASVADTVFQLLSDFFARYGYWAVFFGVMLENSGLPVPGETVLLFSGFLAFHGHLSLSRAIFTAIAGATLGDSLGYLVGRWGGTALINRFRGRFLLSAQHFDRAQGMISRFGHWAVFVARFITGVRVLAGPLAGAFLMPYPRFLLANFSGAVVWAFTIGWVGYLFGSNWQRLLHLFKQVDTAILIVVVLAALIIWLVYRRKSGGQKASR
jgi:membrane protein DedA with SNARE-associated domain